MSNSTTTREVLKVRFMFCRELVRLNTCFTAFQFYDEGYLSGDSLAARGGNLAKIPPNQVIADLVEEVV